MSYLHPSYMDVKLAGYVRSTVRIYYDPADLRRITVYTPDGITGGQFLCQACCQDIEEQKISLKEVVSARTQRRRELQTHLRERKRAARQVQSKSSRKALTREPYSAKVSASGFSGGKASVSGEPSDGSQSPAPPRSRFKSPRFMGQLSPEFVQEDAPSQQSGTKAASSAGTPSRVSSPEERAAREPSSAKVPVSGEPSDGSQSPAPPRSRFKPPHFMEQLSPEFVQKK